jgi:hypothetical protein
MTLLAGSKVALTKNINLFDFINRRYEKIKLKLTEIVVISPVISSNKNIILLAVKMIQNCVIIIVLLEEGSEGLNIVKAAVGLGNNKDLPDAMIMVER